MIRAGSSRKLAEPGDANRRAGDRQRLLAKAEQQIRKLQAKVVGQKQQIRALLARAKHEDNLAVEREELKAEIVDLTSEIRELTRANREQVEKIEALRAGLKVDKPRGPASARSGLCPSEFLRETRRQRC